MGTKLVELPIMIRDRRHFTVGDDFTEYTTGGRWTSVTTGSATIAAGDGPGGILTISAIDSTNNRDVYIKLTNQVFKFQSGAPLIAEARIQYTEANTNSCNIIFGFMDTVGANSLVDDGAGPKTSYSGAVIFKVDGGVTGTPTWKTQSSLAAVQTTTLTSTGANGSAYQTLRIECKPVSSTLLEVSYFVDGRPLKDSVFNKVIKDIVTYTGAVNMGLVLGLKNGSTSAEVAVTAS